MSTATHAPAGLDTGTYEVLRARLAGHGAELARRAGALNDARLAAFGGGEFRLAGAERLRTRHHCVPRDIVPVGGLMLFGYNVFIGLKPHTEVSDVFALHRFTRDGDTVRFTEANPREAPGLLCDERFVRDFAELYRYYRDTRLLQLRRLDGRLLAVFQAGPRTGDVRVLRWRLASDGSVSYLDNHGERDHVYPPPHDFRWTPATRADHVAGRFPHVSIGGEVFVETIGGTLTLKVENNTETGQGVYAEPVAEPLQSLADADIDHARVGPLILLRIRPYKETAWRHLVFNTRTRGVTRLDAIGAACLRLPADQGIVFPGGYYLATGAVKTFDTEVAHLEFERMVRAPNGEDVLYVFHARAEGRTLLLPYNVIREEVTAPIDCHGYSLFDDGTLVVLRALSDEPARVHPMQVWQTPFGADLHAAGSAPHASDGPVARIGNAELVRAVSDCLAVVRMIDEMAPSTAVFEALIAACTLVPDRYPWLAEDGLGDLTGPLGEVRASAEQALEEFEKVQAATRAAAGALADAADRTRSLIRRVRGEPPAAADGWVAQLADLRHARGHLVTLREVRHVDTVEVDALAADLDAETAAAARRAVQFLRRPDAFAGSEAETARLAEQATAVATVAAAAPVEQRLTTEVDGLRILADVVGGLDVADATVRTAILERIGAALAGLNRIRAGLQARRRELRAAEDRAAFAAELALLGQTAAAALAAVGTPDRCDAALAALLTRLDDAESRFGDTDDVRSDLANRREEVCEAFTARKQALLDERARRAGRLRESADRILATVRRRAGTLDSLDAVNTYFATDPMLHRLRAVADELRLLGAAGPAEELDGRIAAARQEAGRALRDRADLYDDAGATLRLGRHRFAVNIEPIDLTLVPDGDRLAFTVTGTDYRAPVPDGALDDTRRFWDRPLASESPAVYRAEYLAASILTAGPVHALSAAAAAGTLADQVRRAAEERYDEGYQRGVHDHDTTTILAALLHLYAAAGPLRYPPDVRAAAQLFWGFGAADPERARWARRAGSLARARDRFGDHAGMTELAAELAAAAAAFRRTAGLPEPDDADLVGEYLAEEVSAGSVGFATGTAAQALVDRLRDTLGPAWADVETDLAVLDGDLAARHQIARAWLGPFAPDSPDLPEAVAIVAGGAAVPRYRSTAPITSTVDGLAGDHPRIAGHRLNVRLDEFLPRLRRFARDEVPAHRDYQRRRAALVTAERTRLRITEYQPQVMSGFVRNRLIDEVYLPLVGDNLARQIGASGAGRHTDHTGLLLLISPPGYGKTTLMEYVASRLGLVFVRVDGPALGTGTTSLDPAQAPDAAARHEVEKISFALELGTNVLLYLDDVQHTSAVLLQRFIPLCDAGRRMEGVWHGRTRTYDLRGKRFAVCLAGNPYTGAGDAFRIPDMLANRADVWNLGDVLTGHEALFELSFLENALTANPALAPLAGRERADLDLLVRLVGGDPTARTDRLTHAYPAAELAEILAVLRHLLRVRDVVLAVNRAYIASAGQANESRTEPPFRLQGSYRTMNRLAGLVLSVHDDAEVQALIDDHYRAEAQTLTTGAEANLLKLAELRGRLTPAQAARWAEVKAAYRLSSPAGPAVGRPTTRPPSTRP